MKNTSPTATFYKIDGFTVDVTPRAKYFSYKELQIFVGGMIQIVPLPSGKLLVVHDEGKLIGLPINQKATAVWKQEYPIEQYPDNNDELIVGDCLITDPELLK